MGPVNTELGGTPRSSAAPRDGRRAVSSTVTAAVLPEGSASLCVSERLVAYQLSSYVKHGSFPLSFRAPFSVWDREGGAVCSPQRRALPGPASPARVLCGSSLPQNRAAWEPGLLVALRPPGCGYK